MASAEDTVVDVLPASPVRPRLTSEQKQVLVETAGELVRAAVHGDAGIIPDPTMAGAAHLMVSGAFISLKRGKHLRSCCGGLHDSPLPLAQAIQSAATATALEDVRFPVVSPSELVYLEMEVWVLHTPQPVHARGEDRIRAVTVGGKHGLIVQRGPSRGLLLPGVAVEHNWDSERFLEQVCIKAGLHPTLWKDDATSIFTFEGEPIRGKILKEAQAGFPESKPFFSDEELAAYAEFCRSNIAALLWGATPNYYLYGVSDASVTSMVLSVSRSGATGEMHLSQLSLRPALPLQSTLFSLSQAAAQGLANQGFGPNDAEWIQIGVSILYDPALHGTVADPHPEGIDSRHRSVVVLERAKSGIAYHPGKTAAELIQQAAELARVRTPAAAPIYSALTQSTRTDLAISNAPRPQAGPAIRPASVAGQFYPADDAELEKLMEHLLGAAVEKETWSAAMVPHAGLIYSGRIAAAVLKRIRIPDTVIIIGPKHTPLGTEWAVAPHQMWQLPSGTVRSDPELARELARAIPGLELDALAHQREHGIEVELPFLARLAPKTRVVGVAMGAGDLDSCRQFAEGLAPVIDKMETWPLLLISSDMNHFATDAETRRLDEMALSALEGLDPANVYRTVTEHHISMCGMLPAVTILETLRRLGGLQKAERVDYATTADVTGDTSRVVGYAGMLFK
jgi:AmmeMemoRadiSam system protein B/AmmeMemoRadiSam system protein A